MPPAHTFEPVPTWAWFALGWFVVMITVALIIGKGARLPYRDPDDEWPP